MTAATLADVVRLLERRYPPSTAESWDAVGLVTGDPAQTVARVLFAVDPVAAVVDEAAAWGADLVVTHHPLLLKPVHSIAATTFKGALLHRLVLGGIGLYTAHTNADAAAGGVADALAEALGLVETAPLDAAPVEALDQHVVFVPVGDAERLVDALSAAGAGAIGEYSRCAWTTTGEGTFTPSGDANPTIGSAGVASTVVEARVEMVAPRRLRTAVIAAMRAAHPYEEPAFSVLEQASWPGTTGHRTGRAARGADDSRGVRGPRREGSAAPRRRACGSPETRTDRVERVAVVGGSGDSLFDAVRALRCRRVRHRGPAPPPRLRAARARRARERDALPRRRRPLRVRVALARPRRTRAGAGCRRRGDYG